jgi:hypothetical protein
MTAIDRRSMLANILRAGAVAAVALTVPSIGARATPLAGARLVRGARTPFPRTWSRRHKSSLLDDGGSVVVGGDEVVVCVLGANPRGVA